MQVGLIARFIRDGVLSRDPITVQLGGELSQMVLQVGGSATKAVLEGIIDVFAHVVQLCPVRLATVLARITERVLVEQVSRLVDGRPDFAESSFANEIFVADLCARVFDFSECSHGVEREDSHDNQKHGETDDQGCSRTDAPPPIKRAGREWQRVHRRGGFLLGHIVRFRQLYETEESTLSNGNPRRHPLETVESASREKCRASDKVTNQNYSPGGMAERPQRQYLVCGQRSKKTVVQLVLKTQGRNLKCDIIRHERSPLSEGFSFS